MEPKIIELEEKIIGGVETRFISTHLEDTNNCDVLPKLWNKFFERQNEIKLKIEGASYGVCHAISEEAEKSHSDEYCYLTSIEVTDPKQKPDDMSVKRLEGGRYAVFTHKGAGGSLN